MRVVIILTQFVFIFLASNGSILGESVQDTTALFDEVIKSKAFVDKTRFIESFLSSKQHLVILAPRGFGKTTNLSMLRLFLETEVSIPERIYKRRREIFRRTEISRDEKFFERHFARYPIIDLNFAALDFQDYRSFRESLRETIRGMYADHRYLLSHGILSETDRQAFVLYFESKLDSNADSLIVAGRVLSKLLNRRFKQKCIVLVDEYDRPGTIVTFSPNITETDAAKIFEDIRKFIGSLLEDNSFVGHSLLTGVLRMSDAYSSNATTLKYISIFDNEAIGKWYGLTQENVRDLAVKFGKVHLTKKLQYWYCGYPIQNSDKKLCITQSIVKSLAIDEYENEDHAVLKHYWVGAHGIEHVKRYLRYEVYGKELLSTVKRFHPQPIETNIVFSEARMKWLKLLAAAQKTRRNFKKPAILQFLTESGYLTLTEQNPSVNDREGKVLIVSPNFETKDALRKMIETKGYFTDAARRECIEEAKRRLFDTFQEWSRSKPLRANERNMITLAKSLNYLFRMMEPSHVYTFMEEVATILNGDGGFLETSTVFGCEGFTIFGRYRGSVPSYREPLFALITVNNRGTAMAHLRSFKEENAVQRDILMGIMIDEFGCDLAYLHRGDRSIAEAKLVSIKNECEEL